MNAHMLRSALHLAPRPNHSLTRHIPLGSKEQRQRLPNYHKEAGPVCQGKICCLQKNCSSVYFLDISTIMRSFLVRSHVVVEIAIIFIILLSITDHM